jgi:hypothetical protein
MGRPILACIGARAGAWRLHRTAAWRLHRTAAIVAALLAAAAAGGCAAKAPAGGATPAATAATAPAAAASTVPTATTGAETATLADGRHPVFVKTVDPSGRTITFDLIQFFMGDAATRAAAQDHQESPPPNDYYIRNVNPRLRTLPVRSDAIITVNVLASQTSGDATKDVRVTLAKLASWFPNQSDPMFWVTVRHGRVTRIAEQFLP